MQVGPVEDDRIGERPADVDPEKHARSLSKRRIAPGRAKGPGDPGPLSLSVSLRLAGLAYTAASEPNSLSSVSTALSGISALSNVSSRCLCDGQYSRPGSGGRWQGVPFLVCALH